ncbi:MAG TPA: hypothetical protein VK901_17150, partial [Nitrospiraceae bacterium]|nr:hypothetical protein [Nitrospiraceae bacterium]
MSEEKFRNAFREFSKAALLRIRQSGGLGAFSGRIAIFDSSRDGHFIDLATFTEAVSAIESLPMFGI